MMKIKAFSTRFFTAVLSIVVVFGAQGISAKEVEARTPLSETKVTAKDLGLEETALLKQSEGIQAVQYYDENGNKQVRNAIVTEYHPKDPNAYLIAAGQKPLEPGETLEKVVDVTFVDNAVNAPQDSASISPFGLGDYYAKNPSNEYATYGTSIVASAEETGSSGGTLTLLQSVTVGNSFNASVSISASVVSLTVGYSVTATWGSTASYAETIKKDNKKTIINAYNKYMTKYYEVWKTGLFSDSLETYGTSDRHVGFRFDVVTEDGYPSM